MDTAIDRRLFQRMASDFTGWYTIKDNEEILGEFFGLDFCAGGIKVNAAKRMLEGRALGINLVSPAVMGTIRETAQIVWQRETNLGIWEAGLEFYQPDLIRLWPLINPQEYSNED